MRINRLEIFGFKSFVDRFVLNFDKDVIGIVGPNGCGKSNIVDALRWVLGETHAKQLRGNVLDDLIFNGSESRRALGMAEVSISFRPDAGWKPALSVIPGGKTNGSNGHHVEDEILSEELISGEGDEDTSVENVLLSPILTEIPGLFQAAEIQFTRRLYRSGESEYFINRVPCRLRDMIDVYRLIGLGARGLSIVQQGQIGEIISKKPVERRELLEEAAGISGFRTRMEAAQRKLERTATNMARLSDIMAEVEKQVRTLRLQANRARARHELKESLRINEEGLFQAKTARIVQSRKAKQLRFGAVKNDLASRQNKLAVCSAEQERLRADLEALDVELVDLRRNRDFAGERLNEERLRGQELRVKLADLDGRINGIFGALRKIDERKECDGLELEQHRLKLGEFQLQAGELEKKRAAAEKSVSEIRGGLGLGVDDAGIEAQELERVKNEIAAVSAEVERIPTLSSELEVLDREEARIRGRLHQHREELNQKRVRLAGIESEVASLEGQLAALGEQVAEKLSAPEGAANHRVLLAGFSVPPELQQAVAAILGDKAHFLVTTEISRFARSLAAGNVKAGKIGIIDQTAETHDLKSSFGRPLIDLLDIKPDFCGPLSALLGNVIVVEDVIEGLAAVKSGEKGLIAVTRAGEVVYPWGFYTTQGAGISFSFTRRIEEQRENGTNLRSEIGLLEKNVSTLEEELRHSQEDKRAKEDERELSINYQKHLSVLIQDLQRIERKAREAEMDAERVAQSNLLQLSKGLVVVQEGANYEEKRLQALRQELVQLENEGTELLKQKKIIEKERAELQHLISDQEGENAEAKRAFLELQAKFDSLESSLRVTEKNRDTVRMSLATVSQQVDSERRESEKLNTEFNELNLALEKFEVELTMMLEEFRRYHGEDLNLPVESEITSFLAESAETLREKINEFDQEVNRLRKR